MAKISLLYFDINSGYYPGFHHGVASLVGSLKSEDHDVSLFHIVDRAEFPSVSRILHRDKPDIIGCSFTTNQKQHVRDFLDHLKVSKGMLIGGGVHCTLMKEAVFDEFPEFEGICIGEGERALNELIKRMARKDKKYQQTPSFYFKNKNEIIKNRILPLADINLLPFPDYSLFNYEKIIKENGNSFAMMLSRGCPFSCSYCSNHIIRSVYPNGDRYVRFLSPTRAIELIAQNLALCADTEKISFSDDTFTINKSWLKDFSRLYQKVIGVPYLCNGRIETINDTVLRYLKNSGCSEISFGLESGNEWLRSNVLNRWHSNAQIEEVFALTRKYKIKSFAYNIVGLPFETRSMVKDTIKLNRRIKPDGGACFYFYPFPGTKLFQTCEEFHLIRDDFSAVLGYLHRPSVKPLYMSYKEMTSGFLTLQMYFYYRRLSSRLRFPVPVDAILLPLVFLFKKQLYQLVNPYNASSRVKKIAGAFRSMYIRRLK